MLGGKSQIPRLAGAPLQLPENVTDSMLSLSLYKMQPFAIPCRENTKQNKNLTSTNAFLHSIYLSEICISIKESSIIEMLVD